MARASSLTFRPTQWSDIVAGHIALAAERDTDPSCDLEWYERQVKEGLLTPYAMEVDGEHVGSFAGRVEEEGGWREFVIVASGGDCPGVDLTRSFLPVIEKQALKAGCHSVRFHTLRVGLIKKAGQAGYHIAEHVLRKVLKSH